MNKALTFLLPLTVLFLFSGSVYGDDFEDGLEAYLIRKDYKEAFRLWLPLAEQGNASAQSSLGLMYEKGQGVPQDYALAHMWFSLADYNGDPHGAEDRNIVEKKMSLQQIKKAQEMARNKVKQIIK